MTDLTLMPLNPKDTFTTIAANCQKLGWLNQREMEQIGAGFLRLLTKVCLRYTQGTSSSLPEETVQDFYRGLDFTLSLPLKTCGNYPAAIAFLKTNALPELYTLGREQLKEQCQKGQRLLQKLLATRLNCSVITYDETIAQLQFALKHYDADFFADQISGLIDYPLLGGTLGSGIFWLNDYLEKLIWENEFCQAFEQKQLQKLLHYYDNDYQEGYFNIASVVLNNALGQNICHLPEDNLLLTAADFATITHFILSRDNLAESLKEQLQHLLAGKSFSLELEHYFLAQIPALARTIAACRENLTEVFTIRGAASARTHFLDNAPMADETFRALMDRLNHCQNAQAQGMLLKENVHSLADLGDIFDQLYLETEDCLSIFALLGKDTCRLLYTERAQKDLAFDRYDSWQMVLENFLAAH